MRSAERFRIQTDRRFEALMLAVGVGMTVVVLLLFRKSGPAWGIPVFLLPMVLIFWTGARVLFARATAIVLDRDGIELVPGTMLAKQDGWREHWTAIHGASLVKDELGECLLFLVPDGRREAIIALPSLGWKIERRDDLLAALAERGLNLTSAPQPGVEDVRNFYWRGETVLFSSRTVAIWIGSALLFCILLEALTHRWDRIPSQVSAVLMFGLAFLQASRAVERLEISATAITLFRGAPKGFLSAYLPRPSWEEKAVWALSWSELRRIRLGTLESRGPAQWLELETPYVTRRLYYGGREGSGINDGASLRALFTTRGFPIELALLEPTGREGLG